jgi:hypothetical protein
MKKASPPLPILLILSTALIPSIALTAGIVCPNGTTPRVETTPDSRKAWCELQWNGKTVNHGPYRSWWSNGRLGTEGTYVSGRQDGKWRGWYPSGQLQGEEWYDNGRMVRSRYYDKKGRVVGRPEH